MSNNQVANPGSALGEAIGNLLEKEIHRILKPLAEEKGCLYLTMGLNSQRTGRETKLILIDDDGNRYNIDSVIVNQFVQPLILVESKYIRYKKHKRDKASWVCTAHSKLRQRYKTVRKSIAILMGSWSGPSKRLLQSFEVELFEVSFDGIGEVLANYDIDFRWAEKDRATAMESWQKFSQLSEQDRLQIGKELIAGIESHLRTSLATTLDESRPRRVKSVTVTVRSNRGEMFTDTFAGLQQAVDFMHSYNEQKELDTANAPSLLN